MNNFLVFIFLLATVSATDYCSQDLCRWGKHIACGHNGQFDSTCPPDAKLVPFTDDLKQLLVDAHNAKRNFIAGGGDSKHSAACRMATMQWDEELAQLAALNVKQCQMIHDACHNTDAFKYSGQNLGMGYFYTILNPAQEINDIVERWYSEVTNSQQTYIDSYPSDYTGPTIGHFTIMMADRNIRVGCAASEYSPVGQRYKAILLACNYATNNMITFPIYKSCSQPASECTTGTNPQYPNLCSASEHYDVNKWF